MKKTKAEQRLKQYNLIEPEIGFLKTEVQTANEMLDTLENFQITIEEDVRAKVDERIQRLNTRIEELEKEKTLIEAVIGELEDPTTKKIFELKYYSLLVWDDIAAKVGYSKRQCQRIHADVINTVIDEKINERCR